MPVSGIIITFSSDESLRHAAVESLQNCTEIELGDTAWARVPAVIDTPDEDADRAMWNWLNDLPGIAFVDLVYVHYDSPDRTPHRTLASG